MSEALETLYASAPVNDLPIHTLTLISDALGTIYLCQGNDDLQLTLETGETVTFTASGFAVSLPPKSTKGHQDLQFQLDNVTGEVLTRCNVAIEAGDKVRAVYRVYRARDLTEPAHAPLVFTTSQLQATRRSVQVVASFGDLVNKAFPKARFTPYTAPGLKYV